jgi:REP element-mobilizing transposase RayT
MPEYRKGAHILVSSPPSLSPSKIMQYVKGRTSRMLQDEFSHLKKPSSDGICGLEKMRHN